MMKRRVNLFQTLSLRLYSSSHDILIDTKNGTKIVTLNRPKQLNALTHSMVKTLLSLYEKWNNDPFVKQIIVKSNCKAFCAGGDLKNVYQSKDPTFFIDQNALCILISNMRKPYISFLNGFTFGAGVGLSIYGKYRIINENTQFAMPESLIGFFCGIGGSFFLSRMPNSLGMYLGLTSFRFNATQTLYSGAATHYVESLKFSNLEQDMIENPNNLNQILETYSTKPNINMKEIEKIESVFCKPTIEDMIQELEYNKQDEWYVNILDQLQRVSPTALKVIHQQIVRGKNMNLEQCLEMEEKIVKKMLQGHDFFEGVRSLLIEKDKKFQWNPKHLKDVTSTMIDSHFS